MASILYARDGVRVSDADRRAELPTREVADLFGLRKRRPDALDPILINEPTAVSEVTDFRHVIVKVHDDADAKGGELAPGYYIVQNVSPAKATAKLVERIFKSEIGAENITGVEVGPRLDSEGRPALKVTVVIPEGAVDRISGEAALAASGKLLSLVERWPRNGTPLIQYATRAELSRHAAA